MCTVYPAYVHVCICTVEDEISREVALNKTPFQSRSSGGNASVINDGNKGTCQLSNRETNPWWSVDLGVKTTVHQINFTNSRISGLGTVLYVCPKFSFRYVSDDDFWRAAKTGDRRTGVTFSRQPIQVFGRPCRSTQRVIALCRNF